MPKQNTEGRFLPSLQRRIIQYLAKNEPQTINKTDRGTHKPQQTHTYKATYTAFKSLQKKGLIKKVKVERHPNQEYDLFWLTPEGVYIAPVEGANAQDLLARTAKIYPNDEILQLFLEMLPLTGIEVYKTAISAILTKGKLEPSDAFMIMLTITQRNLSNEQFNQFLKILRKHPDKYEEITNKIKQLAELLEEKGEIT